MKKVISLILAAVMIAAVFTVSFTAYSVPDEGAMSAKEAIAAYEEETGEEVLTARVYFQMPNGKNGPTATEDILVHRVVEDPETGEVTEYDEPFIKAGEKSVSWYCDYNVIDGKNYAGVYWWDSGVADPDSWCGYSMEIENYDQGIYYVDLPVDEALTTIIFNNGVDGGMDPDQEIYPWAYQTADLNCEGAGPGEYDTLPEGGPGEDDYEYSFDRCIAIVDPNRVTVQPDSGRLQAGVNWYVYYGNGCYGELLAGLDGEAEAAENCVNPDHFENGVHVGFHGYGDDVHTHTIKFVDTIYSTTEHAGMKAHYECTECGKLFTDEAGEKEVTAEELATPIFVPDPSYLYFDASSTNWLDANGYKANTNTVAFHIFGGDVAKTNGWGAKKTRGTLVEGTDGIIGIQASKVMALTEGVQYKIIFIQITNGSPASQTYDLLFDTTCLGHIAYCDGEMTENPVDSSKNTLTAYWRGIDPTEYGPVKQITSIGNVVGTCFEAGRTAESVFVDFLTVVTDDYKATALSNARKNMIETGIRTEQDLIDSIGEGLGLTKQQVYDAFTENEVETVWDYTVSTLPGTVVIPHTHTPAAAVQENVKAATCTDEGSYDEVVYCSECGEELSRVAKTTPALGHELKYVAQVDATYDATGVKAHYECTRCGKLFSDATGTIEVTAASLVIPKLERPTEPPTPDTYLLGDVDDTGEVDITDVTYIQRIDVGIVTADAGMIKRGDVDGSGVLDISDATWIQRFEVGIDVPYSIGKYVRG